MNIRAATVVALHIALFAPSAFSQTRPTDPFAPPRAKLSGAPDHAYDLRHVALELDVDYRNLAIRGVVVNTIVPLRENLTEIVFQCGDNLTVHGCQVAGEGSPFVHEGGTLRITAAMPLAQGKAKAVAVRYSDAGKKPVPGFHWIKPTPTDPQRVGFWTNSEPERNRQWLPTWDYSNDFSTSEMRVTVPADWEVVSNGVLESTVVDEKKATRTFHWRMDQPHATYLNSLVGGRFDVKRSSWRDVSLMYVVPEGKGHLIDDTFGETPEMLSFFSDLTGVKYPWPKYAACVVHGYPGAMENVSATSFNPGVLVDKRSGPQASQGGQSHELSHQWFGDLVTCKDWRHVWLNEGFASFCTQLYKEHARGRDAYAQGIDEGFQVYFAESRRYQHPLAITAYESPADVFDMHTYAKGASVLHTLRRHLGDKAFFAGLNLYLTRYRHQPVESRDLCAALSEASGRDLAPFFEQWVFKPGHPVLDYTWSWDERKQAAVLTVKQTQDVKNGTPVYQIDATVGVLAGGSVTREKIRIDKIAQEFPINISRKPDALLLDPDHDFLREIPDLHWSAEELPSIVGLAPNAVDREEAMTRMLKGTPSEGAVRAAADAVRRDAGRFPALRSISTLGALRRGDLRPLFREQLVHPNTDRLAQAVGALGRLSKDEADVVTVRGLIDERQPYTIVRAAVGALANWDAAGNREFFTKALAVASENDRVRLVALSALAAADVAEGKAKPDPDPELTRSLRGFLGDWGRGVKNPSSMAPGLGASVLPQGDATVARWLKDLRSFEPFQREDVAARQLVRNGEQVASVCHYKVTTGRDVWFCTFSLSSDGKVADFQAFPE